MTAKEKSGGGVVVFFIILLVLGLFFVYLVIDERVSFNRRGRLVGNYSVGDLEREVGRLQLENARLSEELEATAGRLNASKQANWVVVGKAFSGGLVIIVVVVVVGLVAWWLIHRKPWEDVSPKGMKGRAFRDWCRDLLLEEGYGFVDVDGVVRLGPSIGNSGQWIKGSNSLWDWRTFAKRPLHRGEESVESLHCSEVVTVAAVNTDVERTFGVHDNLHFYRRFGDCVVDRIRNTQNIGYKPVKTDIENPLAVPGATVKSVEFAHEEVA